MTTTKVIGGDTGSFDSGVLGPRVEQCERPGLGFAGQSSDFLGLGFGVQSLGFEG